MAQRPSEYGNIEIMDYNYGFLKDSLYYQQNITWDTTVANDDILKASAFLKQNVVPKLDTVFVYVFCLIDIQSTGLFLNYYF